MIRTALSVSEIRQRLKNAHIKDHQPLKTNAGFDIDSDYSGNARKTFSLLLHQGDLVYLQDAMQQLYEQICKDIQFIPSDEVPFPFDFVRVDSYYNPLSKELKMLEVNVRGAGMHEICEFLDVFTAKELSAQPPILLNREIAKVQKAWQEAKIGPFQDALYVSKPLKRRWIYKEALQEIYGPGLVDCNNWNELVTSDDKVKMGDKFYKAIVAKAADRVPDKFWDLDAQGYISIIQPKLERRIGLKNYLSEINLPFVAKVSAVNSSKHQDYINNQSAYVLKIIDSSNARGIYIGAKTTPQEWLKLLSAAYSDQKRWVIQDYITSGNGTAVGHDGAELNRESFLLGIFLLPNIEDPSKVYIDFVVKAYNGKDQHVLFDPAGQDPNIWFGNVIIADC